jgi:RNA polymerase sigma-70 factor (ECF subfamily)
MPRWTPPRDGRTRDDLLSSTELLTRVRQGDNDALGCLLERYLPAFRRWAHGRMPSYLRGRIDTEDLVQDAILGTIRHVKHFEPQRDGALQAYLHTALINRIKDEIRRYHRQGPAVTVDSDEPGHDPSPSQEAALQETIERFETALELIEVEYREAIVARVVLRQSWQQVADALGKPSPDAARMAVRRALRHLAEEMARLARPSAPHEP